MENDQASAENKELEQSLEKMMVSSSPQKFIIGAVVLIFLIAISIPLSGSIQSKADLQSVTIKLQDIASGTFKYRLIPREPNSRQSFETSWCRVSQTAKVFVYLGEIEEFYDNHAAIRNSFDSSQINTFSFLSSKGYDCGPIKTLGDVAKFFNVKISDYP